MLGMLHHDSVDGMVLLPFWIVAGFFAGRMSLDLQRSVAQVG